MPRNYLRQEFSELLAKALETEKIQNIYEKIVVEPLTKRIAELEERISDNEDEIDKLTKRCNNLEVRLDESNEYVENLHRLKNITIEGIKETQDEEIKKKTLEVIKEKVNIELNDNDISAVFRFGKPNQNTNSRKILVKFENKELRDKVYQERKQLIRRGESVFFSEDLPTQKAQLYFKVRTLKKQEKLKSCWTTNGQIYIKADEKDKPSLIKTEADLQAYKTWLNVQAK